MPSQRGLVSLLALSCLLTGPLGDLRPAFAVASAPSPLSVAGEVSPPMGEFAGVADIQRWLDGPPLSSDSRDALRTMTQRNPGISDALVEAFTEEAKRFKSKPEAISLARRWTRAGTIGLIAASDRDRIGQMIAKRAADQNQRGSIPWMLTDEYTQIPGLDTAAAETLIARRTLKHAAASQSPEAADRLIAYLLQHPEDKTAREQTRAALANLRFSPNGLAGAQRVFGLPTTPSNTATRSSEPSASDILDQIRRDNEESRIQYERSLREHQEFLEKLERDRRFDEMMERSDRDHRRAKAEAERRQREDADRRRAEEQRAEEQRRHDQKLLEWRQSSDNQWAAEQRAREDADRKRAEEQRAQERRGREEIERKRAEDQRAAEWRAKVEAERKQAEDLRTKADADRRRAEEQRAAEQRAREDADRRRAEEQRAQERRGREEMERRRAEEQRAAEQRAKAEAERKHAEELRAKAEADRKRAEEQRAAEQRAKTK